MEESSTTKSLETPAKRDLLVLRRAPRSQYVPILLARRLLQRCASHRFSEVSVNRRLGGIHHRGLVFVVAIFSFLASALFDVNAAAAASLYFSPSSGTVEEGKTFTVGIYVSTPEQAMNAAQAIVSFPTANLEAISVSKAGSILNLWVQEPATSNANGSVSLEGIVMNPGYVGSSGKLLSVTFRAKTQGVATIKFSSASILANDGQGSNILTSLSTAKFTVVAPGPVPPKPTPTPTPTPPTEPTPPATLLKAPVVSSPTHPDQNSWYARNDPGFNWPMPKEIVGVNVLLDRQPVTDPGTRSDGIFPSYTFTDVDDGSWYFHVRFKNKDGWGAISHTRVNIDTTPPASVEIKTAEEPPKNLATAAFILEAKDVASGIASYVISIDDGRETPWPLSDDHKYVTPSLSPGVHKIVAKAVDKAGNTLSASAEFAIGGLIAGKAPFLKWNQATAIAFGKYTAAFVLVLLFILFLVSHLRDDGWRQHWVEVFHSIWHRRHVTAYCVKCRGQRRMANVEELEVKGVGGGMHKAVRGTCESCGRLVIKMLTTSRSGEKKSN